MEGMRCFVRYARWNYYLDRTKQFRYPDQQKLIIPYRRGSMKDMTKQTLTNYIKEAIVLAHQEQYPGLQSLISLRVKPTSIRHVATSMGALWAVSMEDVLHAGTSPDVGEAILLSDYLSQLYRLGIRSGRISDLNFYSVSGSVKVEAKREKAAHTVSSRLERDRPGRMSRRDQADPTGGCGSAC